MPPENTFSQFKTGADLIVPSETKIYYSKRSAIKEIRFAVIMLILDLLAMIFFGRYSPGVYFVGGFMMLFFIIISVSRYRNYKDNTAQIFLDDKGMQTRSTPYFYWSDIKGDDVVELSEGRTTGYHLIYNHPKGFSRFSLATLDITSTELLNLLKVYRERSSKEVH